MQINSTLLDATEWIVELLLGTLSISISVVAIAYFGIAMLYGTVPWRFGVRIIIGCFILSNAGVLAKEFRNLGATGIPQQVSSELGSELNITSGSSIPLFNAVPPASGNPFDPYGGP